MRQSLGLFLFAAMASVLAMQASAKVEFMKVLPEGADGHRETIIIKNNGDDPVDMKGWSIVDTSKPAANAT